MVGRVCLAQSFKTNRRGKPREVVVEQQFSRDQQQLAVTVPTTIQSVNLWLVATNEPAEQNKPKRQAIINEHTHTRPTQHPFGL